LKFINLVRLGMRCDVKISDIFLVRDAAEIPPRRSPAGRAPDEPVENTTN
jgi:hypothetical protein